MLLTSPAFENDQEIPQKFGKKFENTSIPLAWEGAPKDTKSFALSMVDYMSPTRYYVHWLACNLSPDLSKLEIGASSDHHMPAEAKELKPYVGPFPPSGTHKYELTLYALKTPQLDVPNKASLDDFLQAVGKTTLAKAQLTGTFTKIKATQP